MKNISFTLGFIAFSSLLTAQESTPENATIEQTNDYCDYEPIVQPQPSFECADYTPQYEEFQFNHGLFLTFDFLYWYARENDLVWGTKAKIQDFGGLKSVATPSKHFHLDSKWSPGVRLGIGWNLNCDGWDLYVNWLYLHNMSEASAHFSWDEKSLPDVGHEAIYNPWTYGSWFTPSFWQNGTARWALNFDQMDLELGKKCWLSRCFILRPYAGLRGTWMHTRFHVHTDSTLPRFTQIDPDSRTTKFHSVFISNSNLLKNHYWGVGLLGGLQSNWALCRNWFIFGNFSGSLVWGKFWGANSVTSKFRGTLISKEETPVPKDFILTNYEREAFYRMQAMLDVALGIRWEELFCANRFSFSLDMGWENHFWFNFGLRHQSTGSIDTLKSSKINGGFTSSYLTESALITDLELGGLVVRIRVNF